MEVRFTSQQRDMVDRAAESAGVTRSELIREATLAHARRILGTAE